MIVYKAKYNNGTLRLIDKPSQRSKTENAIVIFLEEDVQTHRSHKKKKKHQRPYALCKNDFSVTEAFHDPLPSTFMKTFTKK